MNVSRCLKKIEEQAAILSNARKKLMKDEIDGNDFKIIKMACSEELKNWKHYWRIFQACLRI